MAMKITICIEQKYRHIMIVTFNYILRIKRFDNWSRSYIHHSFFSSHHKSYSYLMPYCTFSFVVVRNSLLKYVIYCWHPTEFSHSNGKQLFCGEKAVLLVKIVFWWKQFIFLWKSLVWSGLVKGFPKTCNTERSETIYQPPHSDPSFP